MLFIGGRETLIRNLLLSLKVHTLLAVHPPKGTHEVIQRYLTWFYLSRNEENKKYNWFLGKILDTCTIRGGDKILENSKKLARLSQVNNGGYSKLLNLFGLIS